MLYTAGKVSRAASRRLALTSSLLKGDGSVEYYEWCDNSKLSHISSYKSSFPLRDLCFYPKTCCSVEDTEVAKALQVHPNCLEPVSFRIPRRVSCRPA